ncbi:MAG: hypothetical protein AB2L14_34960 [Candidatus Xenobiia bacterium LiM19]
MTEDTGGGKPPEPPLSGAGDGGTMRPGKSPWIKVPDDWLDKEYSANAGHTTLQESFNLSVRPAISDLAGC